MPQDPATGRFVPIPPARQRLMEYVEFDTNGGCWLFSGALNGHGYGQYRNYDGKQEMLHRVSYEMRHGKIPDDICVLHKCDVRACVNPDHLFLGTKKENAIDAVAKGRWVNNKGERHGMSKLTDEQTEDIRAALSMGENQSSIAKRFFISQTAVSNIKTEKRRKK